MQRNIFFYFFVMLAGCTNGQLKTNPDWSNLYQCEGCEALLEGPENLSGRITIPPADEPGEKMKLSGTVFLADGKTPASDVIVYFYHTNSNGIYPTHGNETGWGKRHGYLRGWIKTNADGKYEVSTIRPGTYPSRTDPAHVHVTVKEPNRKEYWIDEYVFADDPLVDEKYRKKMRNRGGNGIISLKKENGVWMGKRDIVLAPKD